MEDGVVTDRMRELHASLQLSGNRGHRGNWTAEEAARHTDTGKMLFQRDALTAALISAGVSRMLSMIVASWAVNYVESEGRGPLASSELDALEMMAQHLGIPLPLDEVKAAANFKLIDTPKERPRATPEGRAALLALLRKIESAHAEEKVAPPVPAQEMSHLIRVLEGAT
jgi:hypothetical protein